MKKNLLLINLFLIGFVLNSMAENYDTLWTKTYGGDNQCSGNSIVVTDGGYLIAGSIKYANITTEWDFWVAKINANGDTLWTKTIPFGLWDGAKKIKRCLDGNYILYGYTGQSNNYHMALAKIKGNGDTLWTKKFSYAADELVKDIIETNDSGFIMTSKTTESNNDKIRFVKTDKYGNLITEKLLTYSTNSYVSGNSIVKAFDSGYLIAGYTKAGSLKNGEIMVMRVDESGNQSDALTYKALVDGVEAYQIIQTMDSCYLMCSIQKAKTAPSNYKLYISKIDKSLIELWNKTLDYSVNTYNQPASIISTSDRGFVITGATGNLSLKDLMIIKINPEGEIEWRDSIATSATEEGCDVIQTAVDNFLVVGNTQASNTSRAWVLKYGVSTVNINEGVVNKTNISAFPVPVNDFFNIQFELNKESNVSVRVLDITGKTIKTVKFGTVAPGKHVYPVDCNELSGGLYMVKVETEKEIVTKKIIKQ